MLQAIKNFPKSRLSIRSRDMGFKRAKIVECTPKENYWVWIKFDDGLSGEVDLSHLTEKGIFKDAWKTPQMFSSVSINPETNTLSWKLEDDEVDLDPYVLRDQLIR